VAAIARPGSGRKALETGVMGSRELVDLERAELS
jgi:hypothetical protein